MSRVDTHYDNLRVSRDAPIEVIRAAYKALSMKYHPDRNPGNTKVARIMAIINTSYEVLSDPIMRRRHDDWIQRAESVPEAPTPPVATAPPDDIPPNPPASTPRPDNTRRPRPSTRYRTANPPAATPRPDNTPGLDRAQKGIIAFIFVVLVVISLGVYGSSSEDGHQERGTGYFSRWSSTAPTQPLPATVPTFDEFLKSDEGKTPIVAFDSSLVPIPRTGVIRALWAQSPETVLAPLKVITPSNSPNYYVKVVNVQGGKPMLLFFVRSGETASVKIPTGTYIFKYASGERWYGDKYLFGPDTRYRRAEEKFAFRVEGDRVLGHTIELIKQVAGNLKEADIAPQEF